MWSFLKSRLEAGQHICPDPNHAQFQGKTFIDETGTNSTFSTHATNVGRRYYGTTDSIARGVDIISCYDVDDWINFETGFANNGNPVPQPYAVQNHSWIGGNIPNGVATNALQRVDYMVTLSNLTLAAGTNNSGSTPQLLAHGYNSMTVGKTNGTHATGLTTFYGAGRVKPEIVAPWGFTSVSTAMVSGASSILRDAALETNGEESEVVKAMLLAGATKKEFPGWSRSDTHPIDMVYGAGELNIYNSYRIFQGGEFDGSSTPPASSSGLMGWDFGNIGDDTQLYYQLVIDEPADEVSIMLTWHIEVIDTNGNPNIFTPASSLSNLDLAFYDSTNGFPGTLIDFSVSTVDNIEHIYLRDVAPGTYTISVVSGDATPFGLAWRVSPFVDSPATDFTILRGIQVSGTIADVATNDDSYLRFNPGFTLNSEEPPVWA